MSKPAGRGVPAKKIALLHVAKKQLGLDDDAYRDILRRWGGVSSAVDLDSFTFEKVMIRLEQLGFRSTWQKRTFGDRPGMATAAQVNFMRTLWETYNPDDPKETALNAWLSKYHHVSAMRFVSDEKAKKIIPALKAMVARKSASNAPSGLPEAKLTLSPAAAIFDQRGGEIVCPRWPQVEPPYRPAARPVSSV